MDLSLPGEKENKKIGVIATITIHAILLILFIFLVVWREQFPPVDKVGIPGVMVDFGNTDAGKGEVKSQEKEVAEEQVVEEAVQASAEAVETPVAETPMESPHKIKPTEKTTPTPVKKNPAPEPEKPKENPIDPNLLFKKPGDGTGKKAGNQGKETGANSDNYDGSDKEGQGGTNGLSELGWGWHTQPQKDHDPDMGYIIVNFEVNDAGYFVKVTTSGTARPSTQSYYKEQLLAKGRLAKTGEEVQYKGSFKIDLSKH